MSSRKHELLESALRYVLAQGVANLSLRPLAVALGTSPRMLMFHFKSKDGLLRDLLDEVRARLESSFSELIAGADRTRGDAPLKLCWQWASRPKNLPLMRLLYEIQILATRGSTPLREHLAEASAAWQRLAFNAMSQSSKDRDIATLCIAVFDGLMLDLISGGRRAQLTAALDSFLSLAGHEAVAKKG